MQLGKLYIVATPIGNLEDITFRAIETLKSVDLIAAEDTRHSRKLLNHFNISTPMIALHEHNEKQRIEQLYHHLQQSKNIALISDAGTPVISDPGAYFIQALAEKNINIIPIPGACAAIAALSISGLSASEFIFAGFLPAKGEARKKSLQIFQQENKTLLFYEAPHRIENLLALMVDILGKERQAVIARELTKTFETIYRGTMQKLLDIVQQQPFAQKGEFVVVVEGKKESVGSKDFSQCHQLLAILLPELSIKKAVAITTQITGLPRNMVYQQALLLQENKY